MFVPWPKQNLAQLSTQSHGSTGRAEFQFVCPERGKPDYTSNTLHVETACYSKTKIDCGQAWSIIKPMRKKTYTGSNSFPAACIMEWEPATGKVIKLNAGDLLLFSANMIHRGLYGKNRLALDIIFCENAPQLTAFINAANTPSSAIANKTANPQVFFNPL